MLIKPRNEFTGKDLKRFIRDLIFQNDKSNNQNISIPYMPTSNVKT